MWLDRESNLGHLALKSDALLTALRGSAPIHGKISSILPNDEPETNEGSQGKTATITSDVV